MDLYRTRRREVVLWRLMVSRDEARFGSKIELCQRCRYRLHASLI